jgi:hypothetical protein
MSAMTAAKLCGLAVIGGTAVYTLKYSGGKKTNSPSFMAIAKDPEKARDAGMMIVHTGIFVGLAYCVANYGELLSVA